MHNGTDGAAQHIIVQQRAANPMATDFPSERCVFVVAIRLLIEHFYMCCCFLVGGGKVGDLGQLSSVNRWKNVGGQHGSLLQSERKTQTETKKKRARGLTMASWANKSMVHTYELCVSVGLGGGRGPPLEPDVEISLKEEREKEKKKKKRT